jgi:hypothetical protein
MAVTPLKSFSNRKSQSMQHITTWRYHVWCIILVEATSAPARLLKHVKILPHGAFIAHFFLMTMQTVHQAYVIPSQLKAFWIWRLLLSWIPCGFNLTRPTSRTQLHTSARAVGFSIGLLGITPGEAQVTGHSQKGGPSLLRVGLVPSLSLPGPSLLRIPRDPSLPLYNKLQQWCWVWVYGNPWK